MRREQGRGRRARRRQRMGNIGRRIVTLVLIAGAAVSLFPFLWALSVSLQGPGLAYVTPPQFFKPPYIFANYVDVFLKGNFLRYTLNSLIISGACIVGSVASNSFIGFGFAKYRFKGSEVLFFTVLSTMMIPGNILHIPHYIMWHFFGALDTFTPLILPSFFGIAMNIFLMRQCFKSIPNEFYEAALVDGALPPWIFFRVYIPLAKPMLAMMVVNTFMGSWNNMFAPLIYITTKTRYPVTLGLLYIKGAFEGRVELVMASALLVMVPTLVVYLFAQKQFVAGIATAGIKG